MTYGRDGGRMDRLTPQSTLSRPSTACKTRVTIGFLQRKIEEHKKLKQEIEALQLEVKNNNVTVELESPVKD